MHLVVAEYLDDAFVTYRIVLDTSNFDVKFVDNRDIRFVGLWLVNQELMILIENFHLIIFVWMVFVVEA